MSAATSTDWRDAYPRDAEPVSGHRYCYACGLTKPAAEVHLTPYYGKRIRGVCEDCALDQADGGAFTRDELTAYLAKCQQLSPYSFRQAGYRGNMEDFRTVRDRRDRQVYSVRVADNGAPFYVLKPPPAQVAAEQWADQAAAILYELTTIGNSPTSLARLKMAAARTLANRPPGS